MIQTQRLTIKAISEKDKTEMVTMFVDDKIKETYMLPDFVTEEAKEKLFSRFVTLSKMENRFVRGIYHEDTLIGFLNDTEIQGKTIELGYVIAPAYWGKGYMTEALSAVIDYLLANGYEEVLTGAFVTNIASIRVMEKCGMMKMNTHAAIEYRGKLHNCIYYQKKK